MVIIYADSQDEALDLHDLLGNYLVWEHRIYVDGREFEPGQAA